MSTEPRPYYYLQHFYQLLSCAEDQYWHLLTDRERQLISNFRLLTTPQQALLVRLFSRKGRLFRSDKLRYPELPEPHYLLQGLERAGFIRCNPDRSMAVLLNLVTCHELRQWWPCKLQGIPSKAHKSELVKALTVAGQTGYYVKVPFQVIELSTPSFVDLLLLLFFGQPDRDLSTFVTSDLGHVRYENYSLRPEDRLFCHRRDIDDALQLFRLRESLHEAEQLNPESATQLLNQLPDVTESSPLKFRHDRLCNKLGRALEKCHAFSLALTCYQKSSQPPSRERQARILFRQGNFTTALALCDVMLNQPMDESESWFADGFKQRCRKKLNKTFTASKPFRPASQTITLARPSQLPGKGHSIERLTGQQYCHKAKGGFFYVENWLLNALFGLTFWPAVFARVRGAFTHPFQAQPHDLFEAGFQLRRKHEIKQALLIITSRDWHSALHHCWQQKYGISNPFVSWHPQGWALIALALQRIPPHHLEFIFNRMLSNLRVNKSGFPDLIYFPENQGYQLLEVKSPTDQLQTNQARWMRAFAEAHIPYTLLRVHWQD